MSKKAARSWIRQNLVGWKSEPKLPPKPNGGWRLKAWESLQRRTRQRRHDDDLVEKLLPLFFKKRRASTSKPTAWSYEREIPTPVEFEPPAPWVYEPRYKASNTRAAWIWTGATRKSYYRHRPVVYRKGKPVDLLRAIGETLLGRPLVRNVERNGAWMRETVRAGSSSPLNVNPSHIRILIEPIVQRGGGKPGAANSNAKLTTAQRNRLVKLHSEGVGPTELANRFEISRQQVYRIIWRRRWNPQIEVIKRSK